MPCRFSHAILVKLLGVVRRLIRLAFVLSVHTVANPSSVNGGAPAVEPNLESGNGAINKSQSSEDAAKGPAMNLNTTNPISQHSQLIVSMQRLQHLVNCLRAPLQSYAEYPQALSNTVLKSYIQRYMSSPHGVDEGPSPYSPHRFQGDTRTRILDTLFLNLTGLHRISPRGKLTVASAAADAIEDLYSLEIQRLVFCSGARTKATNSRLVGGQMRVKEGNTNYSAAFTVLHRAMELISCSVLHQVEIEAGVKFHSCEKYRLLLAKTSPSKMVYISAGGTIVVSSMRLCLEERSDIRAGSVSASLVHFVSVAETACERYSASELCKIKKQKVADFLTTLNDIYVRPSRDSAEFNACVSCSHHIKVPLVSQVYNNGYHYERFGELGGISIECTDTTAPPEDPHCSISNSGILMTSVSPIDYKKMSEVRAHDECVSLPVYPLHRASDLSAFDEATPRMIPSEKTVRIRSPAGLTPRDQAPGSAVKKSDVAIPVSIAFKPPQSLSMKSDPKRSGRRFKIKVLIPGRIRKAFSAPARSECVRERQANVVHNTAIAFSLDRKVDSRFADWKELLEGCREQGLSHRSVAPSGIDGYSGRGSSVRVSDREGNRDIQAASADSKQNRAVKSRLDSLYKSFRFEGLFVRLHEHTMRFSGRESGSSNFSSVSHRNSGLGGHNSDINREIDDLIGLSNPCSESVGLVTVRL